MLHKTLMLSGAAMMSNSRRLICHWFPQDLWHSIYSSKIRFVVKKNLTIP